jgi:hypothetical protein
LLSKEVQTALSNLAANEPLARLKAIRQLGDALRAALDELVDAAELEQVRAARARKGGGWREVGRALGVSQTQAHRRFAARV